MYLDLTHEFTANMPVFPGDGSPELVKVADVGKDGIANHMIKTSMHVGTHMDAPGHMLLGGKLLSEYPVEKFFGRGVIIDARGKSTADVELLENIKIEKGDIVLVCFSWSTEFEQEDYYLNYPEISPAFAGRLAELGVSILGLDTPSPDRAPYQAHKILFKQDILIIENLTNLEQLIGKAQFEVIALPAKFQADAAPVRVVAKI
ncbi:MAG: cyclase family protein [Candidatus Doudnabacteria bacterium]|jgi:kynurenine formamidase